MKGADLHPKGHSIQIFTDASNEDWGAHLEQVSAKGLWSDKKKRLHLNILELKAVSLALQGSRTSVKPNSVGCYGQLDSSSLHNKQGGTHSAELCALLWKIMTWCHHYYNPESQTNSRVTICDGRSSVQVEPSTINKMVDLS